MGDRASEITYTKSLHSRTDETRLLKPTHRGLLSPAERQASIPHVLGGGQGTELTKLARRSALSSTNKKILRVFDHREGSASFVDIMKAKP